MNKENFQKWIDALRSGDFQQGTSYLNRNGKYCCLGVACEVAIANGVVVDKVVMNDIAMYNESNTHLPLNVSRWLGVQYKNIYLGEVSATHRNDFDHWDFNQIADALQKLVDETP